MSEKLAPHDLQASEVLLRVICDRYVKRGDRVTAMSEIAAMAATHNIEPEDLQTTDQMVEFFVTLGVLGEHSRAVVALQPSYQAMQSPLGVRWRRIRAEALTSLLKMPPASHANTTSPEGS